MSSKELFDYYNESKAHDHLGCSLQIVETFLEMYPQLRNTSLEHADLCFYNFLYKMFFE